ncbi:hypothetical protein GCM10027404_12570 [Arthrobacter tumbae]|uniref:FkbM family methyltransferase n=1 Tax=Arthrobacter tumbae TaxID=163874 RepID=UPI0019583232|nr:FkbM family methyltransferase [Arthrobacter tumbae]MBM7782543.1 FkbM family methyltransferase [Arthrobacter tumbae]
MKHTSYSAPLESVTIRSRVGDVYLKGVAGEYIFELIRDDENFYEWDLLDLLSSVRFPTDHLVVDVGANIGNHTIYFGTHMPHKVIALEPQRDNFNVLLQNIHDNGLATKVRARQVIAWNQTDQFDLENADPNNSGTFRVKATELGSIPARTLDAIVRREKVALIKIDAEGSEAKVLLGSKRILRRDKPLVVTEAHSPEALREIAALLEPLGYEVVGIAGRSFNYVWANANGPLGATPEQLRARFSLAQNRTDAKGASEALKQMRTWISGIVEDVEDPNSTVLLLGAKDVGSPERSETRDSAIQVAQDESARYRKTAEVWAQAYRLLSDEIATEKPGAWSTDAAIRTVSEIVAEAGGAEVSQASVGGSIRELRDSARSSSEGVRVGIATMPGREVGLRRVIDALLPQVSEIYVYLNGMNEIPGNLLYDNRVKFFTGPDYGDRAKFLFIKDFEGYYLTCDDDIQYPDFYVPFMVNAIERYGRRAVVGWHGSIFKDEFEDYYDSRSRRVLSFSKKRGADTPVHLLGTGIAGFHTDTISISFEEFEAPNMADVFLALKAQHLEVPMIVLAHEEGWAEPIEPDADSISNSSLKKPGTSGNFDVRAHVTSLVKGHGPWTIHEAPKPITRPLPRVAVIGRTDRNRWRKGGILKSCHLTASMLRQFGVDCVLEDIETGDPFQLGGANPSIVMLYVGDPERPDFATVERLIEHHADLGRVVIVNMSVNGHAKRNEYITSKMLSWEKVYSDRIILMVFTEAMVAQREFQPIRHLMIALPKTITMPAPPRATFHGSRGIFLGDFAKLSDSSLMDYTAQEWISAIREAVPEAPLFAVEQYKPRYAVQLDIDEVWPHLTEDYSRRISSCRLMFTPIKYATFEMVPVEAAAMGLPVIYPEMPQSLSEYLGMGGVQVSSPAELASVLPSLYRDPLVWRSQSISGRRRAESSDIYGAAGQMYMRIAALERRAKNR